MKHLLITSLTLVILTGCASRRPEVVTVCELVRSVPGTSVPLTNAESVRRSSIVKAYSIGRYPDADDPRVMHEGHVVYVEEASAAWDLRPHEPAFVPLGPAVAAPQPANIPARSTDEWTLQFREQHQVTQQMREQAKRFDDALAGLAATISLTTNLAGQVQQLGRQQRSLVDRLQLLEEAVRRDNRSNSNSNASSTVPATKR